MNFISGTTPFPFFPSSPAPIFGRTCPVIRRRELGCFHASDLLHSRTDILFALWQRHRSKKPFGRKSPHRGRINLASHRRFPSFFPIPAEGMPRQRNGAASHRSAKLSPPPSLLLAELRRDKMMEIRWFLFLFWLPPPISHSQKK